MATFSVLEPELSPYANVRAIINPRLPMTPDNYHVFTPMNMDEINNVLEARRRTRDAQERLQQVLSAPVGTAQQIEEAQYEEQRAYEIYITLLYLYARRALQRSPFATIPQRLQELYNILQRQHISD